MILSSSNNLNLDLNMDINNKINIINDDSKETNINKKNKIRCEQCNCKLNITNSMKCKCEKTFCMKHRFFADHGCTYDYKTEERKKIAQNNPQIISDKLIKI